MSYLRSVGSYLQTLLLSAQLANDSWESRSSSYTETESELLTLEELSNRLAAEFSSVVFHSDLGVVKDDGMAALQEVSAASTDMVQGLYELDDGTDRRTGLARFEAAVAGFGLALTLIPVVPDATTTTRTEPPVVTSGPEAAGVPAQTRDDVEGVGWPTVVVMLVVAYMFGKRAARKRQI